MNRKLIIYRCLPRIDFHQELKASDKVYLLPQADLIIDVVIVIKASKEMLSGHFNFHENNWVISSKDYMSGVWNQDSYSQRL